MDINAAIHIVRTHLRRTLTFLSTYWQPALVIAGIAVSYIGLVATTHALTRSLGWGPAATVAGVAAVAVGLFASRLRVEDRK